MKALSAIGGRPAGTRGRPQMSLREVAWRHVQLLIVSSVAEKEIRLP
jgi:hypothetical protein